MPDHKTTIPGPPQPSPLNVMQALGRAGTYGPPSRDDEIIALLHEIRDAIKVQPQSTAILVGEQVRREFAALRGRT